MLSFNDEKKSFNINEWCKESVGLLKRSERQRSPCAPRSPAHYHLQVCLLSCVRLTVWSGPLPELTLVTVGPSRLSHVPCVNHPEPLIHVLHLITTWMLTLVGHFICLVSTGLSPRAVSIAMGD